MQAQIHKSVCNSSNPSVVTRWRVMALRTTVFEDCEYEVFYSYYKRGPLLMLYDTCIVYFQITTGLDSQQTVLPKVSD